MSSSGALILWLQRYWLFVWALGTVLGVAASGRELPPLPLVGAGVGLLCGFAWWWRGGTRLALVVLLFWAAFNGSFLLAERQQEQLSVNQLLEEQGQYLVLRGRWQNHPHPRSSVLPGRQNSGGSTVQHSMQAVLLVEAWQCNRSGTEQQRGRLGKAGHEGLLGATGHGGCGCVAGQLEHSGTGWQRLPAEARVWVSWRGREGPLLGTEVEVCGKLRAMDRVSPFGIYCQRRGIFQLVQADEVRQLADNGCSGRDGGGTGRDGGGTGRDGGGTGRDGSGTGRDGSGTGRDGSGPGSDDECLGRNASCSWQEGIKAVRLSVVRTVARWRQFCIAATLDHLPEDGAALLLAMALGESARLEPLVLQQFRSAGVGHVMAASGLHLGLVYGAIFGLLRMVRVAKRRGLGLVVGGVWLYAALVGFTPSITRALLMCWFSLLAMACGRPGDLGRALALALVLALWLDPSQLGEVGFQLSYAAVLGIVMWLGAVERLGHYVAVRLGIYFWPGVRQVGSSLALTLAVSLWVAPMLMFYFGEVSWITAVANLLILPPLEIALGAGLVAWVVSALPGLLPLTVVEVGAGWLAAPLWWICLGMERLTVRAVVWLSSLAEPLHFSPSVTWLATYYTAMLILWLASWWMKLLTPGIKMDSRPAL